jgi:hypothetical protein
MGSIHGIVWSVWIVHGDIYVSSFLFANTFLNVTFISLLM